MTLIHGLGMYIHSVNSMAYLASLKEALEMHTCHGKHNESLYENITNVVDKQCRMKENASPSNTIQMNRLELF